MTEPSRVIVLVEDDHQRRFARRYLERLGIKAIHFEPIPQGKQSGEQWVRRRYPEMVRACRSRIAGRRASTALIVMIDADMYEVARRHQQLSDLLEQAGLPARRDEEPIAHFIPKRNIETWLLCLNGQQVNEIDDYSRAAEVDDLIKPAALAFFDLTRPNAAPLADCIPSILHAIREARRLD